MGRRGCLFGCSGAVLVVIVLCGLLYFVGVPRFQNSLRDDLADELSTQVSRQIDTQVPGTSLQPGEYRISLDDLQRQLNVSADSGNNQQFNGFDIHGEGNELVLGFKTSGQALEYRGVPEVVHGRLQMTDMTSTSGVLDFFLPPDKLGEAVAEGVNSYIESQGMSLQDVRIEGSDLVVDVAG